MTQMRARRLSPTGLLMTSLAMAAMRDVAFRNMPIETETFLSKSDSAHTQDILLKKAEEKRLRKQQKRLQK